VNTKTKRAPRKPREPREQKPKNYGTRGLIPLHMAAEQIGVSEKILRDDARKGMLVILKFTPRIHRVFEADLPSYLARRREMAMKEAEETRKTIEGKGKR